MAALERLGLEQPDQRLGIDAQHLGRLDGGDGGQPLRLAEEQARPAEHAAARHAPEGLARADLGLEDMLGAAGHHHEDVVGCTVGAVEARARGIAGAPRDPRDAREQRLGGVPEGRRLAQDRDRLVRGSEPQRGVHQFLGACEAGSAFTSAIGALRPRSLRMSSVHFDSIASGRTLSNAGRRPRG